MLYRAIWGRKCGQIPQADKKTPEASSHSSVCTKQLSPWVWKCWLYPDAASWGQHGATQAEWVTFFNSEKLKNNFNWEASIDFIWSNPAPSTVTFGGRGGCSWLCPLNLEYLKGQNHHMNMSFLMPHPFLQYVIFTLNLLTAHTWDEFSSFP